MRHLRISRPRATRWLSGAIVTWVLASCSSAESTRPESAGREAGGAPDGAYVGASAAGRASPSAASSGTANAAGSDFESQAGTSGGAAGTASAGGTATHAAGGEPNGSESTAGEAGQAGMSDAAAGAAGEPPSAPAGAACISCGTTECSSAVVACSKNPECAPWLACISACNSPACVRTCDQTFSAVARVYYGVYDCLCAACDERCAVTDACTQHCDAKALPLTTSPPATLAETGLYATSRGGDQEPPRAPNVYEYEPRFPLWADGAGKERYIYVPPCATIDTSDMDHWQFPIGTRLWKNFEVDGKRVETRLLHRYGPADTDWLYATYGWSANAPNDPSQAAVVLHGLPDANGTLHDIPDPSACPSCHGKLPDKALGFGAFQLSHAGDGLTMQKLSDAGWLSVPARQGFGVPGTAVEQAALGYLHANCGGCHNSFGAIPRENPMKLRLLVGQTEYSQTDTVLTTIGVPTINAYPELHGKPRVDPQTPENSAVYLRMSDRNKFPMPPLATKFADTQGGVAAVRAWIEALPKP